MLRTAGTRILASVLAASGLLTAGAAIADDVYNNLDNSIDVTLEVMNLSVGSNGTVTYRVSPANGDGKSGCNLGNGEHVSFLLQSSVPGIVSFSTPSITFTGSGCNGTQLVTVTGVAAGTTSVSLSAAVNNNSGGSYTVSSAAFTVNVSPAAPVDSTPPVIVPTVTPAPNGAGWNNTDVTVTWDVSDAQSAITSPACTSTVLTSETAGTVVTCTATSTGGTSTKSVTVKIDKTAPVITGSRTPAANANGWNNEDVTASFTCADAGSVQSGIATDTVAGATVGTEGANQSVTNTGSCVDAAGNTAASATVTDISIDKTAPVITGSATPAPNGDNWNNTDVTVSFACADEIGGSGLDTNTVSEDDVTLSADGADQTASSDGDCADKAGNVAATPVTVGDIDIDQTAPTITASIIDGTLGDNDWYTSDVTVHYTCSDNLSGLNGSCPEDVVLSTEGSSVSVSVPPVTDKAGNMSEPTDPITIKIDKTAPVITGSRTPAANANGWNKTDVEVTFECTDEGSGIVTDTVADVIVSTEGENQSVTSAGECTDEAGLSAEAVTVGEISIDKTAPVVTVTTPANGASYLQNASVIADWTATDALSGIDTVTPTAADGAAVDTAATGSKTFTVTATDEAGNTTTVTNSYSVYTYVFCGFKSPLTIASKDFKKASTIPVKFQVCNSLTGAPLQGPVATLKVNGQNAQSSGSANTGNQFRFDVSDMQYIYNLSTKQLNVGSTTLLVTIPGYVFQTTSIVIK